MKTVEWEVDIKLQGPLVTERSIKLIHMDELNEIGEQLIIQSQQVSIEVAPGKWLVIEMSEWGSVTLTDHHFGDHRALKVQETH